MLRFAASNARTARIRSNDTTHCVPLRSARRRRRGARPARSTRCARRRLGERARVGGRARATPSAMPPWSVTSVAYDEHSSEDARRASRHRASRRCAARSGSALIVTAAARACAAGRARRPARSAARPPHSGLWRIAIDTASATTVRRAARSTTNVRARGRRTCRRRTRPTTRYARCRRPARETSIAAGPEFFAPQTATCRRHERQHRADHGTGRRRSRCCCGPRGGSATHRARASTPPIRNACVQRVRLFGPSRRRTGTRSPAGSCSRAAGSR